MSNSLLSPIKALIFDFDGTLVDTKRYYFQLIADYLCLDLNQVLQAVELTTFSNINHKETNVKWKIIKASFSASRFLGFGRFKSLRAALYLSRNHSKYFSKARPTSNAKDAIKILSII